MEDLATMLVSIVAAGSLVLTVTWLLRGVPGLPWLVGHATLTCTGAAVWATHVLNEGELGYRPAPWLSLVLLMTAGGFGIGFLRWRSDWLGRCTILANVTWWPSWVVNDLATARTSHHPGPLVISLGRHVPDATFHLDKAALRWSLRSTAQNIV